jgi:hypothetical protein
MITLLIVGATILAQGPFTETEQEIISADAIYPRHILGEYQMVDAEVDSDFIPSGYLWDAATSTAKRKFVPPPEGQLRHITTLAFRNRFSQTEKVTIEMAALDNPAGTMEARLQAAAIRVNLADIAAARYIDLDWPDTRKGVQDMEVGGLLAVGRAAAILDSPVLDIERATS